MELNKGILTSPGSSVRNKILISFFLVLTLSGIIMNVILINTLQANLSAAGLETGFIKDLVRHFTLVGSGVTITGIAVVLLVAVLLANTITRPINKLTQGMINVAKGKSAKKISVDTGDELSQLAEGFNYMAGHIESSIQELKASKEYTENIVLTVPSILVVLSNHLQVLSTNAAFDKLKEQFPMINIDEFLLPLDDALHQNLQTGSSLTREICIVPEGSSVSLVFSATVSRIGEDMNTEGKERPSILLTITNVTERTRMKELVLQSKQDWEDTFDTIPDMITIHDKDYNIIMANKAAKDTLNIQHMDFRESCKCFKHYHGTENAPEGCPSCDCYNTKEPATFEVFEPHLNKYIEIRSIPRLNNHDEMIGLIHITRDISLRKEIEDEHSRLLIAITKAKMEWEMTFDSVTEYVLIINKDLEITRCNKSFVKYVNNPIDNIIGSHCYDFFPCSSSQVEDCKGRMQLSQNLMTKNELETESGCWLYISHRPILDDSGEHMKSVIIATDVTDLKQAQERIKDSEKELKAKVDDLEKFYDMAIGRELRMKELKKEIKRLTNQVTHYEEVNAEI